MLVCHGFARRLFKGYLPVGHTYEDIDSLHSKGLERLKVSSFSTVSEILDIVEAAHLKKGKGALLGEKLVLVKLYKQFDFDQLLQPYVSTKFTVLVTTVRGFRFEKKADGSVVVGCSSNMQSMPGFRQPFSAIPPENVYTLFDADKLPPCDLVPEFAPPKVVDPESPEIKKRLAAFGRLLDLTKRVQLTSGAAEEGGVGRVEMGKPRIPLTAVDEIRKLMLRKHRELKHEEWAFEWPKGCRAQAVEEDVQAQTGVRERGGSVSCKFAGAYPTAAEHDAALQGAGLRLVGEVRNKSTQKKWEEMEGREPQIGDTVTVLKKITTKDPDPVWLGKIIDCTSADVKEEKKAWADQEGLEDADVLRVWWYTHKKSGDVSSFWPKKKYKLAYRKGKEIVTVVGPRTKATPLMDFIEKDCVVVSGEEHELFTSANVMYRAISRGMESKVSAVLCREKPPVDLEAGCSPDWLNKT
uniref:DUF7869 domain-containing protein n=1 Tax=Chromera velia CCMP2878 TaxID=1169474 RepID=A0A0G4HJE7_9ALVE|eukprot:Cvel_28244.t1-p1 / transcript=Cvel_28244.t1 / gene=Cvel_28244 / organism=Chromera_velia_CCMP2878 / gene_product=hypothetical protein / transcript_product=hypothetical protein / location=Cvel_scaffold3658:4087-5849(+) / protein_length=466 / sequence_SO=supercontig / SO=protein_coding / is_pseudo=false